MLKIFFGKHKDEIYNTDVYYENQYSNDWTTTDFAKSIIREIDCSEVIGPDQIRNDLFGVFNSTELSAGVKTLLLMYNQPKKVFNISNCGDNCVPYILDIAKEKENNDVMEEIFRLISEQAYFLTCVNFSKKPVIQKDGSLLLEKNTDIKFPLLANSAKETYYPAFS